MAVRLGVFSQSVSPDWEKDQSLRGLCASNERSEWVVNLCFTIMAADGRQKVVVIAGPTASGKTPLGVELALALDGEILNADSMQVYRGMDIGTAKPNKEQRARVRHHLIDVVDPDEPFSAASFKALADRVILHLHEKGAPVFVVGYRPLHQSPYQGAF